MNLDVNELLEALGDATIVLPGGTEYTVTRPTFLERVQLERDMDVLNWEDSDAVKAFVEELCAKVQVPAEVVLQLPEAVLTQVVIYFLAISRGAESLEATVALMPQSESSGSAAESSPPEQPLQGS